jgi:addiction module HigA family antidote
MMPGKYVPAPPIAPGAVLRKRILERIGITQEELADAMGVSRFSVNQIINGRRSVTAEMALRIARVTSTTPDFWLDLQRDVDLYQARLTLDEELERLDVLRSPVADSDLFSDL